MKSPATTIVRRKLTSLTPHPRQAVLFPPLSDVELAALADDIQRHGLKQPVEILPDGTIVCGHQRCAAAKLLGWTDIDCLILTDLAREGDEAVEARLIEDNLHRRHLTGLGVARAYLRLKQLRPGKRASNGTGDWREVVAKQYKISGRTLDRWAKVLGADPSLQAAVDQGRLTLGQAIKLTELSVKKQRKIAAGLASGKNLKDLFPAPAARPADEPSTPTLGSFLRQLIDQLHPAALPAEIDSHDLKNLKHVRRVLRDMYFRIEEHESQMAELRAETTPVPK